MTMLTMLPTKPVLLVLESLPRGLPKGSPALPLGSRWFADACRAWAVPAAMLAVTTRINCADSKEEISWYGARDRVSAALAAHQPEVVVAAGSVARDAVRAALSLAPLPWSKGVVCGRGLGPAKVVAIPHFSGRSRVMNEAAERAAASKALLDALTGRLAA